MLIYLKKGILFCTICLLGVVNCSSYMTVTNNKHEKKIVVKKGEVFLIRLKAQLGTGYGWIIKSKNPQLKQLGKPKTVTLEEDKTSAMDYQVFKIEAIAVGSTELLMHYIQPWEKKFVPASVFKVTIEIVDKE